MAVLEGEDRTRLRRVPAPDGATKSLRWVVGCIGGARSGSNAVSGIIFAKLTEELIALGGASKEAASFVSFKTEVDIKQEAGNLLLTLVSRNKCRSADAPT